MNKIHKYLVKPLCHLFSSKILQSSILEEIRSAENMKSLNVLDVACGDDRMVLNLAESVKLLVANDISRPSMQLLIKESANKRLIFTNQNLLDLQFNIKFDVVICKNVMHHMRNSEEIKIMLNTLKKLGGKLIIMDIENPRLHWFARAWNYYYIHFLKDHGGLFLSFNQFKEIMALEFKEAKNIKYKKIMTMKGYYMMVVIV